jgi:hypothetical protein
VAMALDRLQGFAQNLITMETNRRIQLGREKESRMVDAYNYMLGEEESQISELEVALDTITDNLKNRGVDMLSLKEEQKSINGPDLLLAANEGAMELVNAKLNDATEYKGRLEDRKRKASQILRHIDLFEDALAHVDPAYSGEEHVVEVEDLVAAASDFVGEGKQFQEEVTQFLEFKSSKEQLGIAQEDYFTRLKTEIEQEVLTSTAGTKSHIGKIQAYEIPRQQIVETLKMKTQDPAMVLGRYFAPMGALKAELEEETSPDKQKKIMVELEGLYAGLGSMLYPQLMDAEGNWATPTDPLSAKMARDLSGSLALLNEGDPTEFVAYLDHVQSYYDEMKEDQTEQGRAISNRIRGEILTLLGIDMEVPVQFGDQVLSQIEIILEHYKELGLIELEQSFHGIQARRSIEPNVSFDASYPSPDSQDLEDFMKSKRKE